MQKPEHAQASRPNKETGFEPTCKAKPLKLLVVWGFFYLFTCLLVCWGRVGGCMHMEVRGQLVELVVSIHYMGSRN